MKKLPFVLLIYSTFFSIFMVASGIFTSSGAEVIMILTFLPIMIYFLIITGVYLATGVVDRHFIGKKFLIYYSTIVVLVMTGVGFAGAQSLGQIISAALFTPLAAHFILKIIPIRRKAIPIAKINQALVKQKTKPKVIKLKKLNDPDQVKFDKNRRAFLKLIGSAGLSVFIFSMFTKSAQGAFFGSVPGPGTVSIKDSSGTVIDPSEKAPTDGYKIAELNESDVTHNYFGFTNKDAAWFIMREHKTNGDYRYSRGSSDFATSWTGRTGLVYSRFEDIF